VKAWLPKGSRGAAVAVAILALAAALAGYWISREPASDLASPMRTVAPGLVRLDTPEGDRLLFESEAHTAFLPLISHFETQKSLTHCGPASIAMVLHALELPAPPAAAYGPYRLFTQENVLNELTDSIISDQAVERRGMSLADVAHVLRAYGASVDIHHAGASGIEMFRTLAVDYLGNPGRHVIVNYSRSALGQEGPGHISPLGAYDADSDRFLILDVSRYKAPAVWVSTERLFEAMAEPVGPGKTRTRGFLLIRKLSDIDHNGAPATAPT
jgi:glutathione-S-conjugate glycine hydrolase